MSAGDETRGSLSALRDARRAGRSDAGVPEGGETISLLGLTV